jgi:hypothetical protein
MCVLCFFNILAVLTFGSCVLCNNMNPTNDVTHSHCRPIEVSAVREHIVTPLGLGGDVVHNCDALWWGMKV